MTGHVQTDNRPDGSRPSMAAMCSCRTLTGTPNHWTVAKYCSRRLLEHYCWPRHWDLAQERTTREFSLPSCRTTVYMYIIAGLFPVGRSCFGDCRSELVSCLARRGIVVQGRAATKGSPLAEMRRRRGGGLARQGTAGRFHLSEFLVAGKGLAAGSGDSGESEGWVLW